MVTYPGKKFPKEVDPETIDIEQLCSTDLTNTDPDIETIDERDYDLWCSLIDNPQPLSPMQPEPSLPPATSVSTVASPNESLTRNIAFASKEKTRNIREVLHASAVSMSNATHKTSVSKKSRKRKRRKAITPPPPMLSSPSPSPPLTPGNCDTIDYDDDFEDAQRQSDTEDSETESSTAGPPSPKPAVYLPNSTPVKVKRKKFCIDNFLASSGSDEDISSEDTGSDTEREINEVKSSLENFIDDTAARFVSATPTTPEKINNPFISTQAKEKPSTSVILSPGGNSPAKLHTVGFNFAKAYKKQEAKFNRRHANSMKPPPKPVVRPLFRKSRTLKLKTKKEMGVRYESVVKEPASKLDDPKPSKKRSLPVMIIDDEDEDPSTMFHAPTASKASKKKNISEKDYYPYNMAYYKTVGMNETRLKWDNNIHALALKYVSNEGELSFEETLEILIHKYDKTDEYTESYIKKLKVEDMLKTVYERTCNQNLDAFKDIISTEKFDDKDKLQKLELYLKRKTVVKIEPEHKIVSGMSVLDIPKVSRCQFLDFLQICEND